ncbi:MAG: hypothetical protein KKB34_05045 [Bacteroidetes bacterium]|nr:hypothetical protein [Bacteroidota bacterium]
MPTLKELSVLFAKKQPKQVESITEDSPILDMIPFEEASHELWNVYEDATEITGAGFVDLDAPLPTVGMKSELKKVDLSIMGGIAQVEEDKAQMYGGATRYFAKQEKAILRKSGMTAEFAILYNMIRAHAIANENTINAGGSSNKNHSIVAVRFMPQETTGLYSPKGFKNGAMLDVKAINGGNLMNIKVSRNGQTVEVLGFQIRYKGYFGFQIANKISISVIANVDRVSTTKKLPTATQIDDLLAMVRANNSSTYLFCHPKIKSDLKEIRGTRISITSPNINQPILLERWDNIPIITSYNFLDGTEQNVSFT